jgi:uncharacterized repeat protein (TIGR03803 family)
MNNPTQHRSGILGLHGRAAGAALALTILLGLAVVAAPSAEAQIYTESVLHTFTGPPDGANPQEGAVEDAEGNLYGTTFYGGDSSCYAPYGCGTVFKLAPPAQSGGTWTETVLYSFTGTGGDGNGPWVDLVRDAKGNLYGTTELGGDLSCNVSGYRPGCGVVFKLSPEPSGGCPSGSNTGTGWCETVLHSFTGSPDASVPAKGLLLDAEGNLYGTTRDGGAYGNGAVFILSPPVAPSVTWSETVLSNTDSSEPGGLLRDTQGNLYVPTSDGGTYGNGTVFMLAPPVAPSVTWTETTLYSFTGGADGSFIGESLLQDAQGNLYGIAREGGDLACKNGCGTVYKLAPPVAPSVTWTETTLYTFTGGADGYDPWGVIWDTQGILYGGTGYGGDLSCYSPNGCGTVFKLATTGKLTVLYTFTNEANGVGSGGLMRDAKGNLYGAAFAGGDLSCTAVVPGGTVIGCGTVFKLSPAKATKTATTLSSSPNPSTYGQAVTFTAVVTPAPPDGETVSFMKGTTVLGTGALSSGSASFTTSTLKVGTNAIKAVYAGDANLAASTSKAVSQVVDKATTTTVLTSSQNPSNFGQSVTFTATVAPQLSGTPTGTVTFNNGSTKLGTVSLSGGVARYTTTKLAVGTEPITAVYNGSTSFTTSTSGALSQAVNQANTTTTLVSSLNPSNYKQAVTFTATVSPQFSGTVTGTVTFYDGTTTLETKSMSGGKAKYTTAKLAVGTHSITATYNGSTDFTGSSSAPLTQTVN